MALPETATFSQFAAILGCKPGWVTALRKAGRLVLSDNGKAVRVAESMALVESTKDPARQGVADRHAAARKAQDGADAVLPTSASMPSVQAPGDDGDDAPVPGSPHSDRRAKAMADKEEALARKALREEQIEVGRLRWVDEIEPALAEAATRLRAAFEAMPDELSPELASISDEAEVRARLVEFVENALGELSRAFADISKGAVE